MFQNSDVKEIEKNMVFDQKNGCFLRWHDFGNEKLLQTAEQALIKTLGFLLFERCFKHGARHS
jgi:hypothetical protein